MSRKQSISHNIDEPVKEVKISNDDGSYVKMLCPKPFVNRRKVGDPKRITVEDLMASMRLTNKAEEMDIVIQHEDPNDRRADGIPAINVILACPIMRFLSQRDEDLCFPIDKASKEAIYKLHVDQWWSGRSLETLRPAIVIAIDPHDMMWK